MCLHKVIQLYSAYGFIVQTLSRKKDVRDEEVKPMLESFQSWFKGTSDAATTNSSAMKKPAAKRITKRQAAIADSADATQPKKRIKKEEPEDSDEDDDDDDETPREPADPLLNSCIVANRKLGGLLGQLLKLKFQIKVTAISRAAAARVKEYHQKGEAMRKELSQIVANPEYEKKEAAKLVKQFDKYDKECKTVVKQGKAFTS